MKYLAGLAVLVSLSACASTEDPHIVQRPHSARASALGDLLGPSIPAERDGMSASDTGAILWVCANSPKHEDKEVSISICPSCSQMNYFYWDRGQEGFRCYACQKAVDNAVVKCPECGQPPRRVRTKPVAK